MHAYSFVGDRGRALGLIAALAVVLAIAANAVFEALRIGPAWLVSAPTVAASYALIYNFFDRAAWRWKFLRALGAVETPVVDGAYEGELVSSYNSMRLPIRIEIEQTWTRIIVRFAVTSPQSSESISLAASLVKVGEQQARLTYTYRNTVRPGVAAADMSDHDGTAEVTIGRSDGVISGRYYNYRGRQGNLDLRRVSS